MNRLLICVVSLSVPLSSFAATGEEPMIGAPSSEELRAVQISESAAVAIYAYGNSGKYPFAIFECRSSTQVCYLFRSEEVIDYLRTSSKNIRGELEPLSRRKVVEFFILRFRGISNDISHQRWRSDAAHRSYGPLEPVSSDGAKTVMMLSETYDGYASAMQEVLATLSK